ncbi:hypothetical protein NQZ68_010634 [Dissostichus eleginoides]|nr:hypothetical protein NQZ68_010634 [Dissostichus eleginoides]
MWDPPRTTALMPPPCLDSDSPSSCTEETEVSLQTIAISQAGYAPHGYCCVSTVVSTVVSTQGTQLTVRAICRTAMWINTAGSAEDTLPSLL